MPVVKVCETCKKDFSVPNRRSEKVRFCSWACKTFGSKVKCECKRCGKEFEEFKSQIKYGMGVYCSKPCRDAARTDPSKPFSKHRVKKVREPVFRKCLECGKDFRIPPARKNTAFFCSPECGYASPIRREKVRQSNSGENSPCWDGGIYKRGRGYIMLNAPGHPFNSGFGNRVAEHRLVMEQWMREVCPEHAFIVEVDGQKYLRRGVDVHHRNKIRDDNRRENLLAITPSAHAKLHKLGIAPDASECWPTFLGDFT